MACVGGDDNQFRFFLYPERSVELVVAEFEAAVFLEADAVGGKAEVVFFAGDDDDIMSGVGQLGGQIAGKGIVADDIDRARVGGRVSDFVFGRFGFRLERGGFDVEDIFAEKHSGNLLQFGNEKRIEASAVREMERQCTDAAFGGEYFGNVGTGAAAYIFGGERTKPEAGMRFQKCFQLFFAFGFGD